MADEMRRIKIRRGDAADFNPENMTAGELAINTDDGVVHACYQDGKCHDLVSTDDVATMVKKITLGDSTVPLTTTDGAVNIPAATESNPGVMTTDQVTKVANAVTDIKVDGTALNKTNGAVNIPAATESNPGVMTAEQVTALTTAQSDATKALGKLVKVRVQGKTDMYGKISLPDSTIYPLAALSNTFAITGEYNLRVVNVSTDSSVLAKNTAVDFWIIGLKKG